MTNHDEKKTKYVWVSEDGNNTPYPNCKCEIQEVVSSSSPNNPDDTVKVKKVLTSLGYYKVPEWGITPYTEGAVYDGICCR